jgi:hypothetical protein
LEDLEQTRRLSTLGGNGVGPCRAHEGDSAAEEKVIKNANESFSFGIGPPTLIPRSADILSEDTDRVKLIDA